MTRHRKLHYVTLLKTALRIHEQSRPRGPVRILDAGCGNGDLIAMLYQHWLDYNPVELFGFEVRDHGAREAEWLEETIGKLSSIAPGVDWSTRITSINSGDLWPFKNQAFDIIVSSQVLEHVHNHDEFFSNLASRLAVTGLSVHVFPPRQTIIEPHVRLLGAHWLKHAASATTIFELMYRLAQCLPGLRRCKKKINSAGSAAEAAIHAHAYLHAYENTPYSAQIRRSAERAGLTTDFELSTFVIPEVARRLGLSTSSFDSPYSRLALRAFRPLRQVIGLFGVQVVICTPVLSR